MAITSSVILSDQAQSDARRWITERHRNGGGQDYLRTYLAEAGDNASAALAAFAVNLEAMLEAQEISNNLRDVATNGSLATPTFLFTTPLENFAALRAAYVIATQLQAIMGGDFLSSLTDGQLRTAFGMTQQQVTTLRTNKLTPAANIAASIRAASGA